MACYQSTSLPSGFSTTGKTSYASQQECLNACKEGACCTDTTCSVVAQCQCQGAGQTFNGVGTTCSPNPCICEETRSYGIVIGVSQYLEPPGSFSGTSDTTCQGKGDFNGASVSGFIRSVTFIKQCPGNARATIYRGAQLDNYGNIAGLTFSGNASNCPLRFDELASTTTVEAEVVNDPSGGVYLRVPYTAYNDLSGGPYGVWYAVIRWFFSTNPLP